MERVGGRGVRDVLIGPSVMECDGGRGVRGYL